MIAGIASYVQVPMHMSAYLGHYNNYVILAMCDVYKKLRR
jgi:hypothetical protein